ncbi:hypothetical protein JXR93_09650 [bacterium]|nr:hypothetical protein [bacterium]
MLDLEFLKNIDIESKISIIPIDKLPLNPKLIDGCSICNNYKLSANCPPFFKRNSFNIYKYCLVFKIEILKTEFLDNTIIHFRKLLNLGIKLEKILKDNGYQNAEAFCGNSCKTVLCSKHSFCNHLFNNKCRYPNLARASISAIGVDVLKLFEILNWNKISKLNDDINNFIDICGVVLF